MMEIEKTKSIFTEMFKQQGKMLIETKFCSCIRQRNNRSYRKKLQKKWKPINMSNKANEMQSSIYAWQEMMEGKHVKLK